MHFIVSKILLMYNQYNLRILFTMESKCLQALKGLCVIFFVMFLPQSANSRFRKEILFLYLLSGWNIMKF